MSETVSSALLKLLEGSVSLGTLDPETQRDSQLAHIQVSELQNVLSQNKTVPTGVLNMSNASKGSSQLKKVPSYTISRKGGKGLWSL